MSSAFKTLKTSDVTVTPYVTHRTYNIALDSSTMEQYDITTITADKVSTSITPPGTVTNPSYYSSIRHLYYSYNTPSTASAIPVSEQNYDQLRADESPLTQVPSRLIYDNYYQATAASGTLECDVRTKVDVTVYQALSIPQALYGEGIKPGSIIIKRGSDEIIDDGNGNLIATFTTPNTKWGNVIYAHGLLINPGNTDDFLLPDPVLSITFASTLTIYENQVRCHVNENEFNITQNPSAISGSSGSLYNAVTGSDFNPYVTTVGLYSAASELLAVGKLAQPYPIPSNSDITFIVKWDS